MNRRESGTARRRVPLARATAAALAVVLLATQALAVAGALTPRRALAMGDVVSVRASVGDDTWDGFPRTIHYFDVDDSSGSVEATGYCMNMGRYNAPTEVYDAGWRYAEGPLAHIASNGYPNTSCVAGHQLSELGARTATALAVYMQQGYIEPGPRCHIPDGAMDDGDGGYDLSVLGPRNPEVRQAAYDLWSQAQSADGEPGAAVRIYAATSGRVQDMLVVQREVEVTIRKESTDPALSGSSDEYSLEGARYEVRRAGDGSLAATAVTGADGRAVVGLAPHESYYAVEAEAPRGFVLGEERTAFQTGAEPCEVVVRDRPGKAEVTLAKQDAATGGTPQPGLSLAGATFSAVGADGVERRAATDERGVARFEGLPLGPVRIREVDAPEGYLPDEGVHEVWATADQLGPDGVAHVELGGPVGEVPVSFDIEVAKFKGHDDAGPGLVEPAAGVRFLVSRRSTGEVVGSVTTNGSGYADTSRDPSAWFGAGERPAGASGAIPYDPEGYVVSEDPQTVPEGFSPVGDWEVMPEQMADGALLQYIADDHEVTTRVQVLKEDAGTGEPVGLAGFGFQVLDEAGTPVTQEVWYPSHQVLDTFVTDGSGTVTLPDGLSAGTWTLHEVAAPAPYLLGEGDVTFVVPGTPGSGPLLTVRYADEAATGRAVVAKRAETGEPLPGAEFDLVATHDVTSPTGATQAVEGQVMAHVTTGEDGTAQVDGLPLGTGSATYAFVETLPPAGHVLDPTPHEVALSWQDASTPVVEARAESVNEANELQVEKVERNTGEPVAQTRFEWLREGDESGTQLETDADGMLRVSCVTPGTWVLREVAAAPGHVCDPTPHRARVDADGTIHGDWLDVEGGHAAATLANDMTVVEVAKLSSADESPVVGARLELRDAEGGVVDAWTSEEAPHRIERVEPGPHVIVEVEAPRGHERADDVPVEVLPVAGVQRFEMRDEPVEVGAQVDKRQAVDAQGNVTYQVDFRSTGRSWADELSVTDVLEGASEGTCELLGLVTPRARGDRDGLLNVWYRTTADDAAATGGANGTGGGAGADDAAGDGPNATLDGGHLSPWLEGDGRQLDYDGWHLWRSGVRADEPCRLDIGELGLAEDERVTQVRLEYGVVEPDFSTRDDDWSRPGLKDEADPSDPDAGRGDGLAPAVLLARTTAPGTRAVANTAQVDLYRNAGGPGLEAHDADRVATRASAPLPTTGDAGMASAALALATGLGLALAGSRAARRR